MSLHATLSPSSAVIDPEAAGRGRDLTNSRRLVCPGCGHSTTAGPMALHRCDPGYTGIHHRLVRQRGSAKKHTCVGCRGRAFDWSYDYRDPNDLTSDEGRYSLNLERYVARCRSCHVKHDLQKDPSLAATCFRSGTALGSSGAGARATARRWGK